MNAHEKFIWVCNTIDYKIRPNSKPERTIFLPCFKNTFSKYLKTIKPDETIYNSEYNKITENLSDPIGFLANLIGFKE